MHKRLARRVAATLTTVFVAATALVACVPTPSANAVVDADGFTAAVEGVTVTGPAGVAPVGTRVQLEVHNTALPPDVESFATGIGVGVSITLNDGHFQPEQPLLVTFAVEDDDPAGNVFVLGEDDSTGTGVAFVDSVWDVEQSTVTATVEHLSWYVAVEVDEEKFSEKLANWLNESLGVSSKEPSCVDAASTLRFSAVRDDIVWPCAKETASGTQWSLQSNSGLVWEVLTEPKAEYDPLTSLTVAGIATIQAVNLIGRGLEGDTVVIPMETLKGTFKADGPYTIALQVEPGLSQIATIMFGLSMIFPTKWVDLASRGECLFSVIKTATSSPSGESIRTVLGCVGEFMAGTAGDLIGILLTGPGLLASQLDGLAREISQTNTIQFTLGHSNAAQVDTLPADARWLHDMPQEVGPQPGQEVAAAVPVDGQSAVFENSTSVWVGCDGDIHRDIYYLDGKYTELSFAIGLQDHAPDGLTADFAIRTVSMDDRRLVLPQNHATDVGTWTVQRGTILDRQSIAVDNVWSVSISAVTSDDCGMADIGYGAMLDAYVR